MSTAPCHQGELLNLIKIHITLIIREKNSLEINHDLFVWPIVGCTDTDTVMYIRIHLPTMYINTIECLVIITKSTTMYIYAMSVTYVHVLLITIFRKQYIMYLYICSNVQAWP
jgi:hypothetical protein